MMKRGDSPTRQSDERVEVTFRFYSILNDFLPPWQRQKEIRKKFGSHTSLKDAIESLGIPHTEIALVLLNGFPAGFEHKVVEGARLSVYPSFKSIDIGALSLQSGKGTVLLQFVLDVHLGTLARYLRMLGFDALYSNDWTDKKLAEMSFLEKRVLLTRDPGLLKRKKVTRGYFVRATEPRFQAVEVVREFQLKEKIMPFGRCISCNGLIQPIPKEKMNTEIPPQVKQRHSAFFQCQNCGKIYWMGSHYRKMTILINWIIAQAY